jgi:hypothetical protein
MKTNIVTLTNGKGLWSQEVREVLITKLEIGYSSLKYYPEDPFTGELRAYYEPHGFTQGSWNVDGHGLICTDKLWIKEFKKGLQIIGFSANSVRNIKYGEKDMQGEDYVSMDVGPTFYPSWKRLNKIKS